MNWLGDPDLAPLLLRSCQAEAFQLLGAIRPRSTYLGHGPAGLAPGRREPPARRPDRRQRRRRRHTDGARREEHGRAEAAAAARAWREAGGRGAGVRVGGPRVPAAAVAMEGRGRLLAGRPASGRRRGEQERQASTAAAAGGRRGWEVGGEEVEERQAAGLGGGGGGGAGGCADVFSSGLGLNVARCRCGLQRSVGRVWQLRGIAKGRDRGC
jgi:hypothetical protein